MGDDAALCAICRGAGLVHVYEDGDTYPPCPACGTTATPPRPDEDVRAERLARIADVRLDLLAALAALSTLAEHPTDADRARARELVAELGARYGVTL